MWEATASPYFGTDYQRTNWSRVGLTSDTRAGLISVNAYRNEVRYAFHGASESEDMHDTVYVLQLSDTMKLSPSHALRIGLDYRNNSATSSSVSAGRIGYQVVSGSIMWDWRITPHLSLTNAVRLDHFVLSQSGPLLAQSGLTAADFRGRTIDEPSFNSGLVWNATDADTFRLLMGRGLQLPSIYDLGLQDRQVYPSTGPDDPAQTFLAVGNPHANAAAVSNVELAWDRALPALGARVRTAVFAQRTNNILTNPYEATPVYTNFPDGSQLALAKTANSGNSSASTPGFSRSSALSHITQSPRALTKPLLIASDIPRSGSWVQDT